MEEDTYVPPNDRDSLHAAISTLPPLTERDAAALDAAVEAARRAWSNTMALNSCGMPAERFYNMTGIIAALRDALVVAKPILTDEAAGVHAELERIRSAGVDPRLLRWCSWPGCVASFDASTGPECDGWIRYRHMAVLLCPNHKSTGHWPSYDMDRDDMSKLLARCGCGETAEVCPSNWEAVFAWWERHLAESAPARMIQAWSAN